jgi:hypothetical protein
MKFKRNRILVFACFAAFSSFFESLAIAEMNACDHAAAEAAEAEAQSQPQSWEDLYRSYVRYGKCDDGALAEAHSEFVVYLLTIKWDHTRDLLPLTQAHPRFEKFVLRHVDELMTPEQGTLIERNATEHCPKSAADFCAKLIARLHES